ncbi:MAG: hypothetical protein IPK19_10775 [Chloroflexi bacterium]|nr:hypothetical protein [Chloroflexota bacterium]
MFQPKRGIGKVWRLNDLVGSIGWGLHIESAYTAHVSYDAAGNMTITGPEGQRFTLYTNGSWERE